MIENENEYRPEVIRDENGVYDELSLAKAIYEVLDRRSGEKISVLHVTGKINYTDYIVLCTAKSTTHVRSLSDEVEYRIGLCGIKPDNREGKGDGNSWIVTDYGAVMVHVFTSEAREFYNLDKLFSDAEPVKIERPEANEGENK